MNVILRAQAVKLVMKMEVVLAIPLLLDVTAMKLSLDIKDSLIPHVNNNLDFTGRNFEVECGSSISSN